MKENYKNSCSAYLSEYINKEFLDNKTNTGWYHLIDNPFCKNKVGVVATAEVLILLKECNITVDFDCLPMVKTLLNKQNKDGGWCFSSNIHRSAVEPTALAVRALLLWDDVLEKDQYVVIQNGVNWLLNNRNNDGLWEPISKAKNQNWIYFSCVALQCLKKVVDANKEYIDNKTIENIENILNEGCKYILACFNDNNVQCGWGETDKKNPTLFHTAYVVCTLLMIQTSYKQKLQVIKSIKHLKKYYKNALLGYDIEHQCKIGIIEKYPYEDRRLDYTHSVDVYVTLALLGDSELHNSKDILSAANVFLKNADETNWEYHENVTCWRLFDIMMFCNCYADIIEGDNKSIMNNFKVALTFAGEYRNLVEQIANELTKYYDKTEILYDKFHEADFARPQLDLHLQKLYHDHSDLIVVFLCDKYHEKRWCRLEWRSIRDILHNSEYDKIMYVKVNDIKVEDIDVPGFFGSLDGFVDADDHTPEELAELIVRRYESNAKKS